MTKEQHEALATAGAELASRRVAFPDMVELLCDANECEAEALDGALDTLMDAIGEANIRHARGSCPQLSSPAGVRWKLYEAFPAPKPGASSRASNAGVTNTLMRLSRWFFGTRWSSRNS
jgi:hypothetical protein